MVVLAALPIVTVVVLLLFRTPSWLAVTAAMVVALVSLPAFPIVPGEAVTASVSLLAVTGTVVVIMCVGFSLARLQQDSGAQAGISDYLNHLVQSKHRAVLLYGFAIEPLFESLIGWGIGLVVVMPLLLSTGIGRLKAIQLSLLGFVLCPWGSFAPSLLLLAELTGVDLKRVGTATAYAHTVVLGVLGVTILLVSGGVRQLRRCWTDLLFVWLTMSTVLILVNQFLSPPLAGGLAALSGALLLITISQLGRRPGATGGDTPRASHLARRGVLLYATILFGMCALTLVAPLAGSAAWRAFLTNPALCLLLALCAAPAILGMTLRAAAQSIGAGLRVCFPAVLVTLLFIAFGLLLRVNGMGQTLAEAALQMGASFVVFVPLAGLISGFVTGSNTAAALMIGEPIAQAATGLGLDPTSVLGVHTASTGAAIMTNPSRAVLAIDTARSLPAPPGEPPLEAGVSLLRVLGPAFGANAVIVVLLSLCALLQ